jgi:aspartyl-tRNA(Asn)/glutamyl-tRNA(Gln) amidotransferase subunit C
MSVSSNDVRHIAALSRLALPDERIDGIVTDLNRILEHMDVLQNVNVSAVSIDPSDPSSHDPHLAAMRMRDDVPSPIPLHAERDSFAPEMRDGFFLVPRLATHESDDAEDGE